MSKAKQLTEKLDVDEKVKEGDTFKKGNMELSVQEVSASGVTFVITQGKTTSKPLQMDSIKDFQAFLKANDFK